MFIATLLACVAPPPPQDVVAPAAPVVTPAPAAVLPPAAPPPAIMHGPVDGAVAPVVVAIGQVPPDFTLMDRNPKSPGNGQPVSPKDYVGSAAGFYFTHAT